MPGSVEQAIRAHVRPGDRLPTPTGRAAFIVQDLDTGGLVLLLGAKQTRNLLTWQCLDGIPDNLSGRGWVAVAASRDVNGKPGTLGGYLKSCIKVQVANYVAVVLERACVVELDRGRPARVRLLARADSAGIPDRRRAEAGDGEPSA